MGLSENAKRFPSDVSVNFRLPHFSKYVGVSGFEGNAAAFTAPVVNDGGLPFVVSTGKGQDISTISSETLTQII